MYDSPKKSSRVTVDDECAGLGLLGNDTTDEDMLESSKRRTRGCRSEAVSVSRRSDLRLDSAARSAAHQTETHNTPHRVHHSAQAFVQQVTTSSGGINNESAAQEI